MKVLTETKDSGRIVEFTAEEWREFCILATAAEGLTENDLISRRMMRDNSYNFGDVIPFEGVFGAIKAFYVAKFKLNELEIIVGQFKDAIKAKRNSF